MTYISAELGGNCFVYEATNTKDSSSVRVPVRQDGHSPSIQGRHGNDTVKHAVLIVPTTNFLFKTRGLDELKADVVKVVKATYDTYGRQ